MMVLMICMGIPCIFGGVALTVFGLSGTYAIPMAEPLFMWLGIVTLVIGIGLVRESFRVYQ